MNRLLLVRHASTSATRRAAFPADEPLDGAGVRQATALGRHLAGADRVLVAPSSCAQQTAAAAGLSGAIDPDLAGPDYGTWVGLTLEQVHAKDPDGLDAWRRDPRARPHGGESIEDLAERARGFLRRLHASPGRTVAITDGALIRAAVIGVLGAPSESFWSIDVAPASITELHTIDDPGSLTWRLVRSSWTPSDRPVRP